MKWVDIPIPPIDQRICNYCNLNRVEDEFHFVSVCKLYQNERKVMYANINDFVPQFETFSEMEKFSFLMGNKESDILLVFIKYISKCFDLRNLSGDK